MKSTLLFLVIVTLFQSYPAVGQEKKDTLQQARPFVRGGVYDKPFLTRLFGRTVLGGYVEMVSKFERVEGVVEEMSFEARRFNLFTHSVVSDRVRFFAEIEFEHGTEEIVIEFASLDFEIHPSLLFRGGIILSPLGKFNLAHDSPLNELADRPLVSTQIIPTALSEAGMGFYGALYPSSESRITYELYGVNGFNDGIILSGAGTRIREGRGDVGEDNNLAPSFVGRVAYSPTVNLEIGASFHTGPYNRYKAEGLVVDERRNLTIAALDWGYSNGPFSFLGEYAHASIDVPPSLRGLFAEKQQGVYTQFNYHFARGSVRTMPLSYVTGVARYELVDFDTELRGDAHQRLSLGLNFRPTEDTVFKLDYHYDWIWSRVDVLERSVGINFSIASYF